MSAITLHSDFGAQENKVCHCFHFFPQLFTIKWWDQMPWSYFFNVEFQASFFNLPCPPLCNPCVIWGKFSFTYKDNCKIFMWTDILKPDCPLVFYNLVRNILHLWYHPRPCPALPLPIPGAQVVKNLPAMQETRLRSLGREDPLEEEMATHCSILAWKIPWTEEPGGL